jgi:hypothetical protein
MRGNGIMEIKRYKIQVEGNENFGYIVDFPQMNGLISIDSASGDASFMTFDQIKEVNITSGHVKIVTNIDEFVSHMKLVTDSTFTTTCEMIGTYEGT